MGQVSLQSFSNLLNESGYLCYSKCFDEYKVLENPKDSQFYHRLSLDEICQKVLSLKPFQSWEFQCGERISLSLKSMSEKRKQKEGRLHIICQLIQRVFECVIHFIHGLGWKTTSELAADLSDVIKASLVHQQTGSADDNEDTSESFNLSSSSSLESISSEIEEGKQPWLGISGSRLSSDEESSNEEESESNPDPLPTSNQGVSPRVPSLLTRQASVEVNTLFTPRGLRRTVSLERGRFVFEHAKTLTEEKVQEIAQNEGENSEGIDFQLKAVEGRQERLGEMLLAFSSDQAAALVDGIMERKDFDAQFFVDIVTVLEPYVIKGIRYREAFWSLQQKYQSSWDLKQEIDKLPTRNQVLGLTQ